MRSFIAAVLAAVACSKPAPPTVAPERATVTSLDRVAVHLDVALSASNPNAVDLPVQSVTAKVVLDQKFDLGTTTITKSITLPAGRSTEIDVPLAVKWSDVGALAQLATSSAAIPFTIEGTVDLGGSLLAVAVPFHIAGTVSHEQLMGAVLNSLPGISP